MERSSSAGSVNMYEGDCEKRTRIIGLVAVLLAFVEALRVVGFRSRCIALVAGLVDACTAYVGCHRECVDEMRMLMSLSIAHSRARRHSRMT